MVSSRPHAAAVLRPGSAAVTRRGRFIRNGLTATQLALSLTLLIGALLLVSTMRNLRGVDTGTDPSRVTALFVDLGSHGYTVDRSRVFFERLLEHGRSTTAADALGIASRAPFFGATTIARVHRPSDDGASAIEVASNGVTADYFAALGIPLLRGRGFTDAEAFAAADGTCGPAIVSVSLARRLFGDQDPLGRQISLPRSALHPRLDCPIVGVVADVRWRGPANEPEPMLYRPLARDPLATTSVAILARSAQPTAQVAAALRKAAASIDPTVPLSVERRLTEVIENRMADRRLTSAMLTLLAIVGFLLAAVGLYGLVAETVAERTREFGIRMAVGAEASRIFRTVVSGAGWLAVAGIAAGIPAAILLARALRTQLFGVTPFEPAVYILSAALLVVVVVLASVIPARTATRVDPVAALKAE
jgi:putative ABC transport system permease protein